MTITIDEKVRLAIVMAERALATRRISPAEFIHLTGTVIELYERLTRSLDTSILEEDFPLEP